MEEKGMEEQADYVFTKIPELQVSYFMTNRYKLIHQLFIQLEKDITCERVRH